ncbi:dihydrodipicolinate synthase family protein [Lichenibacterium ramalinae]|uniref:Dihydrodipicolinate synthase family protein n=1 Tax=Lichenibacterium ramalinae TaxID=2316527 RepID=A0A4Q2RJA3_9HYPH|nr:dihydrodipicolinate synthase family protein [Lichenibacterium ramalinae]RYB07061.1 dihydrodipicolinate synthase family protein [Lichenibacterium ramalinae]
MTDLTGLSAFPITPASASGVVDVAALRGLVGRLAAAKVDSVGLLGSTGSYPYLTRDERRRALDAALDEAAGRVPVLVGVGALRTDAALDLARDAQAAGAAAGLLAPVSYTPLSDDEVFEHVRAVADGSGLPICFYDNPGTTHFAVSPALLGRLSRLPGVVAAKSPAAPAAEVAGRIAALRAAVPDGFRLGSSVDWHAAEALLAGSEAWYSVAAGLFPRPCLAILRAARRGDGAEARRLDAALAPLWALFRAHSSLRVVYAAADILGLCRAEPPRPILPLPAAVRADVAAVVERLGLG